MGAYEELCVEGRVGPAAIDLLTSVFRAIAGMHNYPHPEPGTRWNDDGAYEAAVAEFFGNGSGQRRLDKIALQATSEQHLRSLLLTVVRNWFRSLARRSTRGALVRALERVMTEEPTFEEASVSGFWTLRADPKPPGSVLPSTLDRAIAQTPFTIIRARLDARNRRPWASRGDQIAVLTRMLEAAGCAVAVGDAAAAIQDRIGLNELPTYHDIDQADGDPLFAAATNIDTEGASDQALDVFAQLGHRERLVLPSLDEPVREVAERLGLAKSSVQDARSRVRAALERCLDPNDVATVAHLRALCGQYEAEVRTDLRNLASSSSGQEADDAG